MHVPEFGRQISPKDVFSAGEDRFGRDDDALSYDFICYLVIGQQLYEVCTGCAVRPMAYMKRRGYQVAKQKESRRLCGVGVLACVCACSCIRGVYM